MSRYSPTFEKALQVLEEVEGGWSDDPDDAGGATKWGLSTRFLEGLIKRVRYYRVRIDANKNGHVDPEELRRLPQPLAKRIYHECFWQEYSISKLPRPVRTPFFVLIVNTRPKPAIRCLQRAIDYAGADPGPTDGRMGRRTISGAQKVPEKLPARLAAEACLHYHRIAASDPSQTKFLRGWFWRVAASVVPSTEVPPV